MNNPYLSLRNTKNPEVIKMRHSKKLKRMSEHLKHMLYLSRLYDETELCMGRKTIVAITHGGSLTFHSRMAIDAHIRRVKIDIARVIKEERYGKEETKK